MTNFKQYFRSHMRSNFRSLIYILVAVLFFTFFIAINNQPSPRYDYETGEIIMRYYSTLYIPVIVIGVLSYILPVMQFSFFKKRINLDCAYSLPISRKCMGAVHYLSGLIMLFLAYTASYLLNFILLLSRGPGWFVFTPMIAHYFLCLLLGFAVYSLMAFVFNQANTKKDGIWFMILYTFVFVLIISTVKYITNSREIAIGEFLIPWGLLDSITTIYQSLVEVNTKDKELFFATEEFVSWFVIWIVIGVASAFSLIYTFGDRRMEKTEEISDSYFGFKTLIPIYAITGMILFESSNSIILWAIIELLAFVGYTIYRRGFHYKKSDIAILCMLLIFLFI